MKNVPTKILEEIDLLILDYLEEGGDPLKMAGLLKEVADALIQLEKEFKLPKNINLN